MEIAQQNCCFRARDNKDQNDQEKEAKHVVNLKEGFHSF